nr:tRNA threonylcarbamoyladenosine dehydratase [Candidatus Krumholzibacteria bacterium]
MEHASFFHRLEILTGPVALRKLARSRVAVFGLGGVGSWAAEGLVRSGVGEIMLVDADEVDPTNINRQLQTHAQNVGQPKTTELAKRLALISPDCRITTRQEFYSPENAESFRLEEYDFVLDCIDSVPSKVDLLVRANQAGCTIFASMGAAFKLDPTRIRTGSIWQTGGCALAKVIRRKLRETDFSGDFEVVYSPEQMLVPDRTVNGSAVFVTACFGMTLAGLVVRQVMDG